MATCTWCTQDMLAETAVTCNQKVEYPDGTVLDPLPYTHWGGHPDRMTQGLTRTPIEKIPDGHRCHDCNIAAGGTHHPGCDMERCPRCQGQLISCGCLDAGGDEGD